MLLAGSHRPDAASRGRAPGGHDVLRACALGGYAALAVCFLVSTWRSELALPANTDWVPYATGAGLLRTQGLYDAAVQSAYASRVLHLHPGDGLNPFSAPPLVAALFLPFAAAGPTAGIDAFAAVSCVLLGLAALIAWRVTAAPGAAPPARLAIVLLSVGMIPALLNVTQWDALLLVAVLLAWHAQQRGDDVCAGLLLSVGLIKPQLVWLCIPLIAVAGSRRLLAGFGGGALVLGTASMLLSGPSSLPSWLLFATTANAGFTVRSVGLPAIAAVIGGIALAVPVAAALASAVVALAWRWRGSLRRHGDALIPLGVALSELCSPHVFANDLVLLTPALLWTARRDGTSALMFAASMSVPAVLATTVLPSALRILPCCVALLILAMLRHLHDGAGRRLAQPGDDNPGTARSGPLQLDSHCSGIVRHQD